MAVSVQTAEKEYTLKHRAMLFLVLIALGWVTILMDFETYTQRVNLEINETRDLIGDEAANTVVSRAKTLFSLSQKYFPEVDVESESRVESYLKTTPEFTWLGQQFEDMGNKLMMLIYQMFFRLSLMQYWALTLLPLSLAMIFEGLMRRRIKMFEFSHASSIRRELWTRIAGFFMFFLNIYMLLPYAAEFGTYYPPVAILIMMFVLKNTVTHITKTL